jgi:hypothetical protein
MENNLGMTWLLRRKRRADRRRQRDFQIAGNVSSLQLPSDGPNGQRPRRIPRKPSARVKSANDGKPLKSTDLYRRRQGRMPA